MKLMRTASAVFASDKYFPVSSSRGEVAEESRNRTTSTSAHIFRANTSWDSEHSVVVRAPENQLKIQAVDTKRTKMTLITTSLSGLTFPAPNFSVSSGIVLRPRQTHDVIKRDKAEYGNF